MAVSLDQVLAAVQALETQMTAMERRLDARISAVEGRLTSMCDEPNREADSDLDLGRQLAYLELRVRRLETVVDSFQLFVSTSYDIYRSVNRIALHSTQRVHDVELELLELKLK